MTNYLLLFSSAILSGVFALLMRFGAVKNDPVSIFKSQNFSDILANMARNKYWLSGLFGSWLCGLLFAVLLSRIKITIAAPIYTTLYYLVVVVGGYFLLSDKLTWVQNVGVLLMLLGLVLVMSAFKSLS